LSLREGGAPATDWRVVVPMAELTTAKSRLQELGDHVRRQLALAMLLDTLVAATGTGAEVCVVTSDRDVTRAVGEHLPQVLTIRTPALGLNDDITHALRELGPGPAAVLLGDVPAATSHELESTLVAAGALPKAVLADHAECGTTLLTAIAPDDLRPRFGPDSYRRHRAGGASPLSAGELLRRDVDTPADLEVARALGLGTHTARVVRSTVRPLWGVA
jgi:2-phospho-L-lactate guanylyltransferase